MISSDNLFDVFLSKKHRLFFLNLNHCNIPQFSTLTEGLMDVFLFQNSFYHHSSHSERYHSRASRHFIQLMNCSVQLCRTLVDVYHCQNMCVCAWRQYRGCCAGRGLQHQSFSTEQKHKYCYI